MWIAYERELWPLIDINDIVIIAGDPIRLWTAGIVGRNGINF